MKTQINTKPILALIILIALVFLLTQMIRINTPTQVSVITRLGQINNIAGPGMYFTIPFIDRAVTYDTTIESVECITGVGKSNCQALNAATKDLQTVKVEVQVTYRINPKDIENLYRLVQDQSTFSNIIVPSAIEESMKATTSKYTAEELIQKRSEVGEDLLQTLETKLQLFSLDLVSLNITNFEFSEAYQRAIDEKSVVQQQIQTQKATLERAQIDAQIKFTQAEAEAKAIEIQNKALEQSPNYLELKKIEKWDGKLPIYEGSSNGTIIDLSNKL